MKSKEFIKKLRWLVEEVPTTYYCGADWSKWNGKSWNMDCVVSIKSILWGFNADRNKARGGAVYKSNGVADFTTYGGLNYCKDVSTDFSNLVPGEYLCMSNTSHAGIYLGDGKVYECTSAWEHKCMISDIDNKGNRSYKGKKNAYKWTHHGKLNYIDYTDQEVIKTIEELAQEVLDGKHGNGEERKKSLGNRFREVQDLVNEMIKKQNEKPAEEPSEQIPEVGKMTKENEIPDSGKTIEEPNSDKTEKNTQKIENTVQKEEKITPITQSNVKEDNWAKKLFKLIANLIKRIFKK